MTTSRPIGLLLLLGSAVCGIAVDPPQKRTDLSGDPLPDGALLRLGTTRGRARISGFGVLADGTVVTVGPANDVRTWAPDEDTSDLPVPIPLAGRQPNWDHPQVSPDGKLVALYTSERVVVYERPAGALKPVAEFEIDTTRRIVFSQDGSKLLVVWHEDRDYAYTLCDIRTKQIRRLSGIKADPECVAFSGDGKRVAAAAGLEVHVWDAGTGLPVGVVKPGRQQVRQFALDHAGEVVAAANYWKPHQVRFVSVRDGTPVAGLTGPAESGWVAYAPDGKSILVGGRDGVTWWDPAAGKLVRRFVGATAQGDVFTTPGRFTPDGKTLVAYSDQAILRWDAATGKPRFPTQDAGHHDAVYALAVSPDGKVIATGGLDSRVRTWDAATGKPFHNLPTDWLYANQLAFSPDGKSLYAPVPGFGGPVQWDAATGTEVRRFAFDPAEVKQLYPRSLRVSPDGRTLSAVSDSSANGNAFLLTTWDTATGMRRSSTPMDGRGHGPSGCELSPDGRWVSTGWELWPVDQGRKGNVIPPDILNRMIPGRPGSFSADGRLMALTGYPRVEEPQPWPVVVYEVATGAPVHEFPTVPGTRTALSPDGRALVTAWEGGVTFFDLATGRPFGPRPPTDMTLDVRRETVTAVRFFPDGSKVVTGRFDTTALVWPVPSRPKAAKPFDTAARTAAWDALASGRAEKGWPAVWALADDPGSAAFLRTKLKLVFPAEEKEPSEKRLQAMRAVAALELGGSADARKLLAELAAGPAGAIPTTEAKAALERIGR